jgi:multicomponent Na+:H+ antiporter subunit E
VVAVTDHRLLVPVSESASLRNTVAHAVRAAAERAADADAAIDAEADADAAIDAEAGADAASDAEADVDGTAVVHFVFPLTGRVPRGADPEAIPEAEDGRDLLDRIEAWAAEDLGDDADRVTVETALVGAGEYLFSPGDYAGVFRRYADDHDLSTVVFDPGYDPVGTVPLLPALESEVRATGLAVEEAPVERERRGARLVRRGTVGQLLALFGVSFGFYLFLAGSVAPYELGTGAVSAGVVAAVLWRVSFVGDTDPRQLVLQLVRLAVYVPYLLYKIVTANFQIAYVVLHPDLPIDPTVEEFDAAVWSPLPVTTLANSITLTPGTLTVDVDRRHFTVHCLTAGSREDLLAGGLERAVRFVFYGRSAARIASPAERREGGEES